MICKTRRAGIKIIFQSISSHPVFSETNAKVKERKMHNSIVFTIILLLVVLICEINFCCKFRSKLILFLALILWFVVNRFNTNLDL